MFNLFSFFKKPRIWNFKGGIHPPEMKSQTNTIPLRRLKLPEYFIIPLQQHIGAEGQLLVQVGEHVLKGQSLTTGKAQMLPVHAPSSGTIHAIAPYITAHPSGLPERCIHLIPDGEERWIDLKKHPNYLHYSARELLTLIHQAGIAGLGGAAFPTATKLESGLSDINMLIINGAECEPYITADDRLMQEHAEEILEGCRILMHILQPKRAVIAVEDNKPLAIHSLKQALIPDDTIEIITIPTKYPSGGAKQLTQILTGKQVPHGQHSSAIGVIMQNVGTAYAIKRAIVDGEPLIERVITLAGQFLRKPGNVWGLLGTPIIHLLKEAQFSTTTSSPMIIIGGPLMGFTVNTLNAPMSKISNCLLAPSVSEFTENEPEQPCIRCSLCVEACPAGLLPQQLYWFSRGDEHEKARQHHLFDCIECGACAYVCPSNIPLVQYYRQEKAQIREIDRDTRKSTLAKQRFEMRQARLEREKIARQQKHQQAASKPAQENKELVQAALARIRQQQADKSTTQHATVNSLHFINEADNPPSVLAREARKAQARLHKERRELDKPTTEEENHPLMADIGADSPPQVALSAEHVEKPKEEHHESTSDDARKAAIAAAIARVKAKKAAQSSSTPSEE